MALRTVYGNTHSENGWPMVDANSCEWVVVPGTNPPVKLFLATGQPLTIMRAFMADWNAYIEPLRDADTAAWTATNSVGTSNHLSGSAVDGDWNSHRFHVSYDGFTPTMTKAMRELLDFYTYEGQKIVWWGQDWGEQGIGPYDCMHVNLAPGTYNNPKTQDFIDRKIRPSGLSTYKRGAVTDTAVLASAVTPREKVLPFVHSQQLVAQEKPWDCAPASVQIILSSLGINMSEDDLIKALHTTTEGTSSAEAALPILNEKTAGKYVAVWLPNDPPRPDQVEALWHNCVGSISAGFGVLLNFELTSAHFPRGERGSFSPQWRGAKVWHFLACMAFADDGGGKRYLGISDPGFPPFDQGVFWMSVEAVAAAITPHAYAYATAGAPPAPMPAVLTSAPTPPRTGFASVSPYRTPGEAAIGGIEAFQIADDGMIHAAWVEWSAMLGDPESIYRVLRAAVGKGADTSPAFIRRAKAVLRKVPRDDLGAALALIEKTDPELLKAVIV